jgi:hypothetical protein
MKTRLALVCLFTFCAFAGMAQTLTTTFQFSANGYIGTPATATTPFQGKTFTNAAITITAIGNTANFQENSFGGGNCVPSDSATVTIGGIGAFQFLSSAIIDQVEVDPIKGVQGNSISFNASSISTAIAAGSCVGGINPITTTIPGSTPWTMTTSIGSIQTSLGFGYFQLATNGGTLSLNSGFTPNITGTFQAIYNGAAPTPTLVRYGVLSHIAAGGGWTTVITLVNNSTAALPVMVALHNQDGSALSLQVTTTLAGIAQTNTTSSINATINPKATLLISTGDGIASTAVGWADILSSGTLGGFAIFRQTPQTGSPSEGTVPLQSQSPTTLTLPYDDTNGFIMGVALANLSTTTASVIATIWDDSGNQLGTQTFTIAGSGHTSFVLPTQISATAGRRGIVQFQNPGGLAGLGLRFSPFGTFTSVPTM